MSRPQTATGTAPSYTPTTPQRTSRMAIWSLVLSILTLGGAGSIAGIVVGVVTLLIAIAYWIFIAMHTGGGGGGGTGGGGGGY